MSELTKRLLGMPASDDAAPAEGTLDQQASAEPTSPDSNLLGLYDAILSGWFQNDSDELFTGIPISGDDVVLDAGCGEGGVVAFCARRGAHIIAVDMHQGTLDKARELLSTTAARKLEFHCSAADKLPVADGVASRILCTEVLEHVEDPARVIRELYRVGQPGALYLFSAPETLGEALLKNVGPESYFRAPNHVRVFDREAFAEVIKAGGLEIVSHTMTGFFWSVWWALYWGCKPDLSHPYHPVLDHWTMAWRALVDTELGLQLKHKLDDFMPKSQIVVARKPS
jgi:ubiquinone/menaquinone biosynthesis C-methylase UbiE